MTYDDAMKIAAVVGTADGGCPSCVRGLVEQLNAKFPEFEWTVTKKTETYGWSTRIIIDIRKRDDL